jgi:hypothetical protein
MAIYLMKRHTGLGNAEIGEIFGGLHYSAVSKVASRFESATAGDSKLSNLAKTVIQMSRPDTFHYYLLKPIKRSLLTEALTKSLNKGAGISTADSAPEEAIKSTSEMHIPALRV